MERDVQAGKASLLYRRSPRLVETSTNRLRRPTCHEQHTQMDLRDRQSCLQGAYEDVRLTTRRPWAMEETSADRCGSTASVGQDCLRRGTTCADSRRGAESSRADHVIILAHLSSGQKTKCQVSSVKCVILDVIKF